MGVGGPGPKPFGVTYDARDAGETALTLGSAPARPTSTSARVVTTGAAAVDTPDVTHDTHVI